MIQSCQISFRFPLFYCRRNYAFSDTLRSEILQSRCLFYCIRNTSVYLHRFSCDGVMVTTGLLRVLSSLWARPVRRKSLSAWNTFVLPYRIASMATVYGEVCLIRLEPPYKETIRKVRKYEAGGMRLENILHMQFSLHNDDECSSTSHV